MTRTIKCQLEAHLITFLRRYQFYVYCSPSLINLPKTTWNLIPWSLISAWMKVQCHVRSLQYGILVFKYLKSICILPLPLFFADSPATSFQCWSPSQKIPWTKKHNSKNDVSEVKLGLLNAALYVNTKPSASREIWSHHDAEHTLLIPQDKMW